MEVKRTGFHLKMNIETLTATVSHEEAGCFSAAICLQSQCEGGGVTEEYETWP